MSSARSNLTVLIVDDDEVVLRTLERAWGRDRQVATARDSKRALEIAKRIQPNLALIDLRIITDAGTESGIDVIRDVTTESPETIVALLSGNLTDSDAKAAIEAGAAHVFDKVTTTPTEILYRLETGEPLEREQCIQTPTIERLVDDHIARVVDHCGGNRAEAARRLGVVRSTVNLWLAKHARKL